MTQVKVSSLGKRLDKRVNSRLTIRFALPNYFSSWPGRISEKGEASYSLESIAPPTTKAEYL
jgi:hypothetical protein